MKKHTGLLFTTSVALLFLASCIIVVREKERSGESKSPGRFWKEVQFVAGGSISLENKNGDIEISGWEADKAEITAVDRESGRGSPRSPERKSLGPEVQVIQDKNSLRISTLNPGKGSPGEVDVSLKVPHSVRFESIKVDRGRLTLSDVYGRLSATMNYGDVRVENFSGSLILSLVRGSVDAEVLDLRTEDEIKITTKQGDITLHLQENASAAIAANAPNGQISSDLGFKDPLPAKTIAAKLGKEKGASISLLALNGNIKIVKAE